MGERVRIKAGLSHRVKDVGLLDGGDVFEASDAELEAFGDKFEEIFVPETEARVVVATDAAADLAAEHDLDLSTVEGTGQNGRITVGDVRRVVDG